MVFQRGSEKLWSQILDKVGSRHLKISYQTKFFSYFCYLKTSWSAIFRSDFWILLQ